jgi:microfibrillar-associated protein 1
VVDYKEKKNWKFMQKYWHKGAYYQTGADDQFQDKESDDIFRRDFSAPTGEDKFDKTILPKVMQVGCALRACSCSKSCT